MGSKILCLEERMHQVGVGSSWKDTARHCHVVKTAHGVMV